MVEKVTIDYHEWSEFPAALLYQILEIVLKLDLFSSIPVSLFKDGLKICSLVGKIDQERVPYIANLSDITKN